MYRDLSFPYALSTRFCNAVGIGTTARSDPRNVFDPTLLIWAPNGWPHLLFDRRRLLTGMAHPQHDSQRAVPQPFLFSEWNIPSISLKDNSQQPSFFPPFVVHRLRQELAGAQKKLEEYEDISTC